MYKAIFISLLMCGPALAGSAEDACLKNHNCILSTASPGGDAVMMGSPGTYQMFVFGENWITPKIFIMDTRTGHIEQRSALAPNEKE